MTIPTRPPSVRGLLLLLAGEGVGRGISFVAIWLLTQRLGREAYAPVAVVLAAMMFASLLVERGLPLFGAREVARSPAAVDRLLPRALGAQLAVASGLSVVAFTVARIGFFTPEIARLVPGYAASLLFLPLLVPWVFQGLGAMQWVAVPAVVRQGLFLTGSALLVRSPADVGRLPWAEVGAVAGAALLAQGALRGLKVRLRVDARGAFDGNLLRETASIGSSQILWAVSMYLGTLCLWVIVPKQSVSHYDVAHRVMMVLQGLLTMYFTNLYPAIARAVHGPSESLHRLLWRSLLLAGAVTLAVAMVTAAGALPLLQRLFPKGSFANAESAQCLAILAFVIPVLACRGHARITLFAMGEGRRELRCSFAATALLALLVPWWTMARGATGAALALLAAEGANALFTYLALFHALRAVRPGVVFANADVER